MKNYITEFTGTFFLVFVIGLTGGEAYAPVAIGTILMVMVYMGGHISGAHYNPAVSIAMIIRGLLSKKEATKYIVAQVIGAFLAAMTVYWMNGSVMQMAPNDNYSFWQIFTIELLFTFALVLVIMHVATNPKTEGNDYYGLAIGFTIMAAAFAGGEISGGAYNPAVALGPILSDVFFSDGDTLNNLWYYIFAPIIGGVLAVYQYRYYNS